MWKRDTRGTHALFQSIGDDGITWRFVIHADDKWSITRDGVSVGAGLTDRVGINCGVRLFLRLTSSGNEKRVDPTQGVKQTA